MKKIMFFILVAFLLMSIAGVQAAEAPAQPPAPTSEFNLGPDCALSMAGTVAPALSGPLNALSWVLSIDPNAPLPAQALNFVKGVPLPGLSIPFIGGISFNTIAALPNLLGITGVTQVIKKEVYKAGVQEIAKSTSPVLATAIDSCTKAREKFLIGDKSKIDVDDKGKVKTEFHIKTKEDNSKFGKEMGYENEDEILISKDVKVDKSKENVATFEFEKEGVVKIKDIVISAGKGAKATFDKEKGILTLSKGDIQLSGKQYPNLADAEFRLGKDKQITFANFTSTAKTGYEFSYKGKTIQISSEKGGHVLFDPSSKKIEGDNNVYILFSENNYVNGDFKIELDENGEIFKVTLLKKGSSYRTGDYEVFMFKEKEQVVIYFDGREGDKIEGKNGVSFGKDKIVLKGSAGLQKWLDKKIKFYVEGTENALAQFTKKAEFDRIDIIKGTVNVASQIVPNLPSNMMVVVKDFAVISDKGIAWINGGTYKDLKEIVKAYPELLKKPEIKAAYEAFEKATKAEDLSKEVKEIEKLSPDDRIKELQKLRLQEKYKEREFQIAIDRQIAETYIGKGTLTSEEITNLEKIYDRMYTEQSKIYEERISKDPTDMEAMWGSAVIAKNRGRQDDALKRFNRVVAYSDSVIASKESVPEEIKEARKIKAGALMQLGPEKFLAASRELEEVIKTEKDPQELIKAYSDLAIAYSSQENGAEKSLKSLTNVKKLTKDDELKKQVDERIKTLALGLYLDYNQKALKGEEGTAKKAIEYFNMLEGKDGYGKNVEKIVQNMEKNYEEYYGGKDNIPDEIKLQLQQYKEVALSQKDYPGMKQEEVSKLIKEKDDAYVNKIRIEHDAAMQKNPEKERDINKQVYLNDKSLQNMLDERKKVSAALEELKAEEAKKGEPGYDAYIQKKARTSDYLLQLDVAVDQRKEKLTGERGANSLIPKIMEIEESIAKIEKQKTWYGGTPSELKPQLRELEKERDQLNEQWKNLVPKKAYENVKVFDPSANEFLSVSEVFMRESRQYKAEAYSTLIQLGAASAATVATFGFGAGLTGIGVSTAGKGLIAKGAGWLAGTTVNAVAFKTSENLLWRATGFSEMEDWTVKGYLKTEGTFALLGAGGAAGGLALSPALKSSSLFSTAVKGLTPTGKAVQYLGHQATAIGSMALMSVGEEGLYHGFEDTGSLLSSFGRNAADAAAFVAVLEAPKMSFGFGKTAVNDLRKARGLTYKEAGVITGKEVDFKITKENEPLLKEWRKAQDTYDDIITRARLSPENPKYPASEELISAQVAREKEISLRDQLIKSQEGMKLSGGERKALAEAEKITRAEKIDLDLANKLDQKLAENVPNARERIEIEKDPTLSESEKIANLEESAKKSMAIADEILKLREDKNENLKEAGLIDDKTYNLNKKENELANAQSEYIKERENSKSDVDVLSPRDLHVANPKLNVLMKDAIDKEESFLKELKNQKKIDKDMYDENINRIKERRTLLEDVEKEVIDIKTEKEALEVKPSVVEAAGKAVKNVVQRIGLTKPSPQDLLKEGISRFDSGKYDQALLIFDRIIKETPVSAKEHQNALNLKVLANEKQGNIEKAIEVVNEYKEKYPTDGWQLDAVNMKLAGLYEQRAKFSEAANLYLELGRSGFISSEFAEKKIAELVKVPEVKSTDFGEESGIDKAIAVRGMIKVNVQDLISSEFKTDEAAIVDTLSMYYAQGISKEIAIRRLRELGLSVEQRAELVRRIDMGGFVPAEIKIEDVRDLGQLDSYIEKIGKIKDQTPEYWKDQVDKAWRGEIPLDYITREAGLRQKVADLKPFDFLTPDYCCKERLALEKSPYMEYEYTKEAYKEPEQGFKIHISADLESAADVADIVLPILRKEGIPHKVLTNVEELKRFQSHSTQAGKFIAIYPRDDAHALELARKIDGALVASGKPLSGPAVPTDKGWGKSGLIYYRYGILKVGVEKLKTPDGRLVDDVRKPGMAVPEWQPDIFEAAKVEKPKTLVDELNTPRSEAGKEISKAYQERKIILSSLYDHPTENKYLYSEYDFRQIKEDEWRKFVEKYPAGVSPSAAELFIENKKIPAYKKAEYMEAFSRLNEKIAAEPQRLMSKFEKAATSEEKTRLVMEFSKLKAVDQLIDVMLKEPNPDVKATAAFQLGQLRDKKAVEPLIKALADPSLSVKTNVMAAFESFKDPRTVDPLIEVALKDSDPKVRDMAVTTLGIIKDVRAVQPLIKALKDPDIGVRRGAAFWLGEFRDSRALEPLTSALGDLDPVVRDRAASAIEKIKAVPALVPEMALATFTHEGKVYGVFDSTTRTIYYDFEGMKEAGFGTKAQAVDALYLHEAFHDLLSREKITVANEEALVSALAKSKVGVLLTAEEALALSEFKTRLPGMRAELKDVFEFPELRDIGTEKDTIGDFMLKLQRAAPGAAFVNVEGREITPEFVAELKAKAAAVKVTPEIKKASQLAAKITAEKVAPVAPEAVSEVKPVLEVAPEIAALIADATRYADAAFYKLISDTLATKSPSEVKDYTDALMLGLTSSEEVKLDSPLYKQAKQKEIVQEIFKKNAEQAKEDQIIPLRLYSENMMAVKPKYIALLRSKELRTAVIALPYLFEHVSEQYHDRIINLISQKGKDADNYIAVLMRELRYSKPSEQGKIIDVISQRSPEQLDYRIDLQKPITPITKKEYTSTIGGMYTVTILGYPLGMHDPVTGRRLIIIDHPYFLKLTPLERFRVFKEITAHETSHDLFGYTADNVVNKFTSRPDWPEIRSKFREAYSQYSYLQTDKGIIDEIIAFRAGDKVRKETDPKKRELLDFVEKNIIDDEIRNELIQDEEGNWYGFDKPITAAGVAVKKIILKIDQSQIAFALEKERKVAPEVPKIPLESQNVEFIEANLKALQQLGTKITDEEILDAVQNPAKRREIFEIKDIDISKLEVKVEAKPPLKLELLNIAEEIKKKTEIISDELNPELKRKYGLYVLENKEFNIVVRDKSTAAAIANTFVGPGSIPLYSIEGTAHTLTDVNKLEEIKRVYDLKGKIIRTGFANGIKKTKPTYDAQGKIIDYEGETYERATRFDEPPGELPHYNIIENTEDEFGNKVSKNLHIFIV